MPDKSGTIIRIVCILVTIIWGALSGVIYFMGNTVRANDTKATTEHTAIRKESIQHDDKVRKELMLKIEAVQMEQKVMRKETNEGFTQMTKETNQGFTKVIAAIADLKR